MTDADLDTIRESATAVLLREAPEGFEVLMLQKNATLNYGGSWVFPGGVTEEVDHDFALHSLGSGDRESAALATVIRETTEETGLKVEAKELRAFSNWLTPKLKIKRYNTLFFVAVLSPRLAQQPIQIDDSEIVAYQWIRPSEALEQQARQEMALNGPSYVTLSQLSASSSASHAADSLCRDGITWYEPRGAKTDSGIITVYAGDVAYDHDPLNKEALENNDGPRNRLYMNKAKPWKYDHRV